MPNSNEGVILDIDLDYVSCVDNPAEIRNSSIEITEYEYIRFARDK